MTTLNSSFWGFVYYLQHNPFKAAGGMTNDDITNMANAWAATNSTEVTEATQPLGTFTSMEWPDKDGGAGTVQAAGTVASVNSAWYPEQHQGS